VCLWHALGSTRPTSRFSSDSRVPCLPRGSRNARSARTVTDLSSRATTWFEQDVDHGPGVERAIWDFRPSRDPSAVLPPRANAVAPLGYGLAWPLTRAKSMVADRCALRPMGRFTPGATGVADEGPISNPPPQPHSPGHEGSRLHDSWARWPPRATSSFFPRVRS
jgi:hypothetical protein